MTHLFNDPAEFKNDVLKGFAAAYPQYVQRVPGASGFVRARGPLEGKAGRGRERTRQRRGGYAAKVAEISDYEDSITG